MATVTRLPLSASTDFRGILVAATATPGTTIHTAAAVASAVGSDDLWLGVENFDTSGRLITFEWGGTTSPNDLTTFTIPAKTFVWVYGGRPIGNSLIVRAFAEVANLLIVAGYIGRVVN